jgi:uncharacterized protein (TIGR03032 family)
MTSALPDPLPPFSCTHTPNIPALLTELNCSLIISTYQAGKVILLSAFGEGLVQLPRNFNKPMGLAAAGSRLAVATRDEVVILVNDPKLSLGYPPAPGKYDALFAPRAVYFCGELDLHDMAWHHNTLWAVNTRFSCLCQLDQNFSFTPHWRPPFISDLTDEDRCHLNGLVLKDGEPLYVTALGATDTPKGWRANKTGGGILMHVPSGEIILHDLPMPHSPRLFDGQLYLLNSATGELVQVDPANGAVEVIARLPGFVRGLACHGDHLFVGMSKLRQGRPLGDIPLAQQELLSGVAVVHLSSGRLVGLIHYLNDCEEIYDVQILPNLCRPGILGLDQPLYRHALSTPEYGFWSQPPEGVSP